jgi:hypothetical protein
MTAAEASSVAATLRGQRSREDERAGHIIKATPNSTTALAAP